MVVYHFIEEESKTETKLCAQGQNTLARKLGFPTPSSGYLLPQAAELHAGTQTEPCLI